MPFAPLTDTRVAWNNSYHIEDEERSHNFNDLCVVFLQSLEAQSAD